jgi:branched-chain amino acid aminotransferase
MAVYHVDGTLVDGDASLLTDRGFWYGDAATETLRAFGGRLFEWTAHAARLREACANLDLDPPDADDLRARVHETLDANGLAEAAVRVSVTRGRGTWALAPGVRPSGDPAAETATGRGGTDAAARDPAGDRDGDECPVVVAVRGLPRGGTAGTPVWDAPARLQTVKVRATPARSVPDAARTHNRLDAVLARRELVAGADEALLLDADGHVHGGATADLCFLSGGAVRAPDRPAPTVARDVVLDLAREEGFPVETGAHAPDEVRRADEAFLVAPTLGVRPVGTVDGIDVGGGPLTRLLSHRYAARVEAACYGGSGDARSTDGDDAVDAGDGGPGAGEG